MFLFADLSDATDCLLLYTTHYTRLISLGAGFAARDLVVSGSSESFKVLVPRLDINNRPLPAFEPVPTYSPTALSRRQRSLGKLRGFDDS